MTKQSINIYKHLYRKKLKAILVQLSSASRQKQDRSITRQIIQDPQFKKSKSVCLYSGLSWEVSTKLLMKSVISSGKQLFAPRVEAKGQLAIYEIKNPSRDFKKGSYDILEPDLKRCAKADPRKVGLWIIPGVAFDLKGRRLGRGAGYFDRFFEKLPKAKKWALAYKEQMLPEVPTLAHDVHVDRVIVGK